MLEGPQSSQTDKGNFGAETLIVSYRESDCLAPVAAMASFLVFTTLLFMWAPMHLYLNKADFVELRAWIIWVKQQVDEVKTSRMEEEMMKARQRISSCKAGVVAILQCFLDVVYGTVLRV